MIRPWRIRVRYGRGGGLVFFQEGAYVLEEKFWTEAGAQHRADQWEADWKAAWRQLSGIVVLVDVVHARELAS